MGQRSSIPNTTRPVHLRPSLTPRRLQPPADNGLRPPEIARRRTLLRLNPTAKSPAIFRPAKPLMFRSTTSSRISPSPATSRPVSPFSQALVPSDSTRGRRAQDDFDYQQSQGFPERRSTPDTSRTPGSRHPSIAQTRQIPPDRHGSVRVRAPGHAQTYPPDIACTVFCRRYLAALENASPLVGSRLAGVFEQPGQEQPEAAPVTPEGDPHAGSRSVPCSPVAQDKPALQSAALVDGRRPSPRTTCMVCFRSTSAPANFVRAPSAPSHRPAAAPTHLST